MKLKKNVAISDSGFIFNAGNGESFSLNPMGLEILDLVFKNKPFKEIKSIILDKYDTAGADFEKDYEDFINNLRFHKLLEE